MPEKKSKDNHEDQFTSHELESSDKKEFKPKKSSKSKNKIFDKKKKSPKKLSTSKKPKKRALIKNVTIIRKEKDDQKDDVHEDDEDFEDLDHELEDEFDEHDDGEDIDEDEYEEDDPQDTEDHEGEIKHEQIQETIADIYQNPDGTMPDMHHFKSGSKFGFVKSLLSFVASITILGGLVYAAIFYIGSDKGFSEDSVIVSISGEETVYVGKEAKYRIRYRNRQDVDLNNVNIEVQYPAGFIFTQSSRPTVEGSDNLWDIGKLEAGGSGFIDIAGNLLGSSHSKQSFRLFFQYEPENFSSEFQKVSSLEVETTEAPVQVILSNPDQVLPGISERFKVIVKRDSSLKNLALEVGAEDMTLVSSKPELDRFQTNLWSISDDAEEFELELEASFSGEESTVLFPLKVLGWRDANKSGDPFVYFQNNLELPLLENAVNLSSIINGTSKSLSIQPAEMLNTSIIVKNGGEVAMKDVSVKGIFTVPSQDKQSLLKWSDLDDAYEGRVSGEQVDIQNRIGEITWDKGDIDSLASIEPGEQVIIDLRIPVKTNEDITLADFKTASGTFSSQVKYTQSGNSQLLTSKEISLVFNSDLNFEVRDELDADDSKIHNVTWVMTNSFHELENIEVRSEVFGDAKIASSSITVPAGEATLEDNMIIWKVPRMPLSTEILPLSFTVERQSLNPSQTQLMNRVEIRATDTVTGREIIMLADPISLIVAEEE